MHYGYNIRNIIYALNIYIYIYVCMYANAELIVVILVTYSRMHTTTPS